MPYREDLDAATARRDALHRELTAIQARLSDHEPLQAKVRTLTDELAELDHRIDRARARVSLPLLASATISTPCKEPWDRMKGTDQVRFCGRCEKDVFNLSAMTAGDAEALLRERGAELCARFYRRPDGTVLTSDCPVGAKRRRRRRLVVTAVAVAAGALGVAWMLTERGEASATAQIGEMPPPPPVEPMMGGIAMQPDFAPPHVAPPVAEVGTMVAPGAR